MNLDKKEFLLSAIKDQDDFYTKNQTKILSSLKDAKKVLSEKDRVQLYAKVFEKEGIKKQFLEEDLSVLQKAYLRALRHMPAKNTLLFLFLFGFDKKEDLLMGKTPDIETLKDHYGLVERFIGKTESRDILKRRSYFLESAKKNLIPLRILDCYRHLGYIEIAHSKPLKGAIDASLFFALLYIVLLNPKTKLIMEKNIKNNMFHFPGQTEINPTLMTFYKEAGIAAPAPA